MKSMVIGVSLLLAGGTLAAQGPADIRAAQQAQLRQQQRMILSMIDSMPQQWFRDRATPQQRDFAMQLFHTAAAIPFLTGRTMGTQAPPGAMDSTAATASKDALRGYVNTIYNWASAVLRDQPDSVRTQTVNLFGNMIPRWQVWDELHTHSMWTLGQVVANFRAHNLRPAPFIFF
jgi:hypothetical protein